MVKHATATHSVCFCHIDSSGQAGGECGCGRSDLAERPESVMTARCTQNLTGSLAPTHHWLRALCLERVTVRELKHSALSKARSHGLTTLSQFLTNRWKLLASYAAYGQAAALAISGRPWNGLGGVASGAPLCVVAYRGNWIAGLCVTGLEAVRHA